MTRSTGLVVTVRVVGEHHGPAHLAALVTPGPPSGAVATLCGELLASGRPVTWAQLPAGHALGFCREMDLFGVIHTLKDDELQR